MIAAETIKRLHDWGELVGYFLAVPIAIAGLIKWLYEIAANRKQRADELRWKQAQSAKELLDDIHNHELSKQAVHMMDWEDESAEYWIGDGEEKQKTAITYKEVLDALGKNAKNQRCGKKEAFIRDCFDWFFYRVDRIEHYIRRGLIQFEDVRDVFKVYARQVNARRDVFDGFLRFHEYELAHKFFRRYHAAVSDGDGSPPSK
jgi:hypothetical protein